MRSVTLLSVAVASCVVFQHSARADSLLIDPTSDGSLYTCFGCNVVVDGGYLLVGGYIQGAVKFSTGDIQGPVTQALLSLNAYGLPLWGQEVSIYAYGTSIGQLDITDANAGALVGVYTLPAGLGHGEDVFFDVTSFVSSTKTPYLAFNIRTTDTDVFSSLEYNYGHPSQLHVTTAVPELPAGQSLGLGLLVIAAASRRSKEAGGPVDA